MSCCLVNTVSSPDHTFTLCVRQACVAKMGDTNTHITLNDTIIFYSHCAQAYYNIHTCVTLNYAQNKDFSKWKSHKMDQPNMKYDCII